MRIMREDFSNSNGIFVFLMISSHPLSLHSKLVPASYPEYKNDLLHSRDLPKQSERNFFS